MESVKCVEGSTMSISIYMYPVSVNAQPLWRDLFYKKNFNIRHECFQLRYGFISSCCRYILYYTGWICSGHFPLVYLDELRGFE